MAAVTAAETRRRRTDLVRRVNRAGDASDVFAEASHGLHRLVPFDAAAWVSTDPATGLPTGPTRLDNVEGITSSQCSEHWRYEFVVDDINKLSDLALADQPVAALRAAAGDPARSIRYRRFLEPLGFDDELRAVLRVGDAPWGAIILWRRQGQPAFSPKETELVATLTEPIAEALRVRARPAEALGGLARHDRPGLMIFDSDGELMSADDQARVWLGELPPDHRVPTGVGVDIPLWLVVMVFRAAAVMFGNGDGTARARVRSRRGSWLVCHASCLRQAERFGTTVVVIEPATPAEIAPIIIDAFALSDREQQITRLIARGAATADIARELYLSPHTVRDHIKEIFQKVEVSSRGELVAKLFAEYYEPLHMGDIVRARAG
jgi:DNA-binding CsgD family transcriptional regulator